jgi:twinkle protein
MPSDNTLKEDASKIMTSNDNHTTLQYLDEYRGITRATFEKFGVKANVTEDGTPVSLITPFGSDDTAKQIRYLREKGFSSVDMKGPQIFGLHLFEEGGQRITITEGAIDAMSHYQMMGNYPVCSVVSSSSAHRDVAAHLDKINSFDEIILCFDNDEPGQKAAKAVQSLFPPHKVKVVTMSKHNDPNDYLINKHIPDYKKAWWGAKRFQRDDILSSYDDILNALNSDKDRPAATLPWPILQEKTHGIRRGDVLLVTAQEGIGKTEVIRAMEYHFLNGGIPDNENVGILHLEEDKVRSIKGLAGYELGLPIHLPGHHMNNEEVLEAYRTVTKRDDRLHIFTHFGSDSVDDILGAVRYLAASCGCRYIFFDHITMVVTGQMEDQTKGLDYLSTQLKMMAKELEFGLILVSHVNDNGETRGSRNIGKIADTRLSLHRDHLSEDPEIRNTTKTLLEKNRFGGVTGWADHLLFDPHTFRLTPITTPLPTI